MPHSAFPRWGSLGPIKSALAGACATLLAALPAQAGPTLLLDVGSGRVLYAQNADQPWYPASLTKIMTAYLTFEALRDGRLTLEQQIPTSERAALEQPSKIGLPVGATISVDLALKSVIIKSANDASVMIAEAVDGTVEAFVARMNQTARRLGMSSTNFVNPNGLPAAEQVTTARDLAKLARAVLQDFPEHAHYWALPEMRLGKVRMRSHNSLLRTFSGATGLKTGFICDSGFNVVASAEREGLHLAAIVLGEPNPQDRQERAASLLEHGFNMNAWKTFLGAPDVASLPAQLFQASPPSVRREIKVWDCRRRPQRVSPSATARTKSGAQPPAEPDEG
ncbi:MAG: D-alanyl-D-alanine carboxypeptidase family protein [Hyphomicrobiaceae bacterium]